jgi:hypothetical protein
MGLVLSHAHDYVLAQRIFEEPPGVNDLARLLADAMQRPMSGSGHRPTALYLRARPTALYLQAAAEVADIILSALL